MWPKVLGAWELHRATEHLDLELFILFSSMSGVRGNPGQANYASANAFLDQLARHRRALGLPGQAVEWGAWLGIGEAEQHRERIESTLAASGAEWMTPQQGVRALESPRAPGPRSRRGDVDGLADVRGGAPQRSSTDRGAPGGRPCGLRRDGRAGREPGVAHPGGAGRRAARHRRRVRAGPAAGRCYDCHPDRPPTWRSSSSASTP